MGSGQSLEAVDELDENCLSEISSGYHSDSLTELSAAKKMAKPALRTRPSVIIGAVTKQQQERENELEKEILQKSPDLKKVFKGFQECLEFLQDLTKRQEKYYMSLDKLLHSKMVKTFVQFAADDQRMVMANKLASMNFVKPLVEYYKYLYEELDIDGITNVFFEEAQQIKEEGNENEFGFPLILTIREIMWNYSDGSHSFSEKLSETSIFENLVFDLKMILEEGLEDLKTCQDLFAFYSSVGILHNCARNPDIDKDKFRKVNAVAALYPFLKSEVVYVKMVTMLAIGNIVTEDEISKFAADVHVIDFLREAILDALKTDERKQHGFHLSELVDGLASMAQSEQTKKEIMTKEGILPTISKIIDGKKTSEILACVKLIWELAFSPENKEIIKSDKKLMATLKTLRNTSDYDLKTTVDSVWFILVDKDERKKPEEKGSESEKKMRGRKKQQHIMISYCWSDKQTVLKIYEKLSNEGYQLWIDVNNMGQYGNLLEGMARAIEDAYIVIICFSEKYKQSQNCRTEADYVYSLRKTIVPLKMQRGYRPDGWLGILLGARLYIEFSHHYEFDSQMKKLRETIVRDEPVLSIESAPVVSPESNPKKTPSPAQGSYQKVANWTNKDVDDWIKRSNLETGSFKVMRRVTGEHLAFLYRVMVKSPDTYYRWLETKLELRTLDDLMKFDTALRSLGPFVSC